AAQASGVFAPLALACRRLAQQAHSGGRWLRHRAIAWDPVGICWFTHSREIKPYGVAAKPMTLLMNSADGFSRPFTWRVRFATAMLSSTPMKFLSPSVRPRSLE